MGGLGSGIKGPFGDVGANANYLSHLANSVISSNLVTRFTDDVVISRNRDTDATAYPNFPTASNKISSSPSPLASSLREIEIPSIHRTIISHDVKRWLHPVSLAVACPPNLHFLILPVNDYLSLHQRPQKSFFTFTRWSSNRNSICPAQ